MPAPTLKQHIRTQNGGDTAKTAFHIWNSGPIRKGRLPSMLTIQNAISTDECSFISMRDTRLRTVSQTYEGFNISQGDTTRRQMDGQRVFFVGSS